jgi:Cu/Ag efflux pump CusA
MRLDRELNALVIEAAHNDYAARSMKLLGSCRGGSGTFRLMEGPNQISRENGKRRIVVTAMRGGATSPPWWRMRRRASRSASACRRATG